MVTLFVLLCSSGPENEHLALKGSPDTLSHICDIAYTLAFLCHTEVF